MSDDPWDSFDSGDEHEEDYDMTRPPWDDKKEKAKVEEIGNGSKLSVTLKGGKGYEAPWIVLHVDSPQEALNMLNELRELGLMEVTAKAAAMFRDKNGLDATPPARGGATNNRGNGRPQNSGSGKTCHHGDMVKRTGTSAKGPWTGYFCPLPKGDPDQCAAVFV